MTSSPASPGSTRPARLALIIPALNEEQALAQVLDELPRARFARILVVDNGSTDNTAAVARARGAEVIAEPRRGYGQACLAGLAQLDEETEIVVFMDADGSDVPDEAQKLVEPILAGAADLVIGSRVLGRAEANALGRVQRWGNRLAVTLVRLLYGFRYTDLGPFRAIRRASLERLGMADRNFGWTAEMQVKALRQGLRVREVPVSYRARIGRSKISGTVTGALQAGTKIIWTILRLRVTG
ncbi:MAG: glycosyltransferase family 2 protein [Terriglobia bacterium]